MKRAAKKRATRQELLDEKFNQLAKDALGEAEAVQCNLKELITGFKVMRDYLNARIEGAEEELAQGLER